MDDTSKEKYYFSLKAPIAFSRFMYLPSVPQRKPTVGSLNLIGQKNIFFGSGHILSLEPLLLRHYMKTVPLSGLPTLGQNRTTPPMEGQPP